MADKKSASHTSKGGKGSKGAKSGGSHAKTGLLKAEIVDRLAAKAGADKKTVEAVLDALSELTISELQRAGTLKIPGFVNFDVVMRGPRKGRNPKTGEILDIAGGPAVKVKPTAGLKNAVTGK